MTCDFGDPPSHREHSNIPLALASEGAPSAKFRTRKSYELRVLRGKPDLQRPTLNLQRATQVKAVYYSPLAAVLPVANRQSPFTIRYSPLATRYSPPFRFVRNLAFPIRLPNKAFRSCIRR